MKKLQQHGFKGLNAGAALLLACAAGIAGSASAAEPTKEDAALAAKAQALVGKQPGQSFNGRALAASTSEARTDTITITLAPGKGAEIKAAIDAGQGFVFHWVASGDVLVDMHGELPDAKDEYTSYAVEKGLKQASGTWVAPFSGNHGWYWQNQGKQPITVQVTVTGFQKRVFRPGHQ